MQREILSGARLILPDRTIEGSLVIEDGRIAEILPGRFFREGLDLTGRFLAPGIIDIHTDYIEKEVQPRAGAVFPIELAFHFMDLRAIGCGVTTVLCAARISPDTTGATGTWHGNGMSMVRAYEALRRTALARHYIHVRWDPNFEPVEEILEELLALDCVGNLVYNDSTPGQRQFRDLEMLLKRFASRQNVTMEEARADFERRIERARRFNNRGAVHAKVAGRIPLGSHDDTTVEHVLEAHRFGATLAEMPCTIEAARKAKELGMMVCMGAPNYYRGGSHCGNLGCQEALAENLVDILCSDYHFPSLLASALKMMEAGKPPEQAFRLLTLNPARHLGMDRELGSIETGKRADLIVFEPRHSFGAVSHVWVDGHPRLRVGAGPTPRHASLYSREEGLESEPVTSGQCP